MKTIPAGWCVGYECAARAPEVASSLCPSPFPAGVNLFAIFSLGITGCHWMWCGVWCCLVVLSEICGWLGAGTLQRCTRMITVRPLLFPASSSQTSERLLSLRSLGVCPHASPCTPPTFLKGSGVQGGGAVALLPLGSHDGFLEPSAGFTVLPTPPHLKCLCPVGRTRIDAGRSSELES